MKKRIMTDERKHAAAVLLKEGKTDAEIAKRLNFPTDMITAWRQSTGIPEADKAPRKPYRKLNSAVTTYTDPALIKAKPVEKPVEIPEVIPEPVRIHPPTPKPEPEEIPIEAATRIIKTKDRAYIEMLVAYLRVYLECETPRR